MRSPNRVRFLLFTGALALCLSVYKGDHCYGDVQEQLEDAQRLALTGSLRIQEEGGSFRYTRYANGLPVVAIPFAWVGHALNIASNGAIVERGFTTLVVPILASLAVVLIFEWGRLLGLSDQSAVASAIIVALSSPLSNYTRFFFTEVLGFTCTYLTCVCIQRARAENGRGIFWLGLSGVGLGFLPHSHMSSLPTFACLFLGFNVMLLSQFERPFRERIMRALTFSAAPVISVALFALTNYLRYGSPFTTGYHATFPGEVFIEFKNIPGNFRHFARLVCRSPWLVGCVAGFFVLRKKDKFLAATLLFAFSAQGLFWLCYRDLYFTTFRYLLMFTALCSLGFPMLAQFLERKLPNRGLTYAVLIFLPWGLVGYLLGDGVQALYVNDPNGKLYFFTWYMNPQTPLPDRLGSPGGAVQFSIFVISTLIGVSCLATAWLGSKNSEHQA